LYVNRNQFITVKNNFHNIGTRQSNYMTTTIPRSPIRMMKVFTLSCLSRCCGTTVSELDAASLEIQKPKRSMWWRGMVQQF